MGWNRKKAIGVLTGWAIGWWANGAYAQEPEGPREIVPLPEILVTAPARLPEVPLTPAEVPASVQIIMAEEIKRSGALNLQDVMQQLPGVHLNDQQGNAYQFDASFRGFTGTSVTGVPQGISVFVDGVRVNEPAVEEINFDLIPLDDVERIELIRGPTAVFGRNALAGSLNVITKRGAAPRAMIAESAGGSFGRAKGRGSVSGSEGPLDYYLSGSYAHEDGWRDQAAARVSQFFGKLGYRQGGTDLTLSYQYHNNRIEQAGSLPSSRLQRDRQENFTGGDFFQPDHHQASLNVNQTLGAGFSLALNGFVRSMDAEQFNVSLIGANSRLFNDTLSGGGTLQMTHEGRFWGRKNLLTMGVEYTRHDVDIKVFEEADDLSELESDLSDDQDMVGFYVQDTTELGKGLLLAGDSLVLTAAFRYDYIRHDIIDRGPEVPGKASGEAAFERANPRVGLNYNLSDRHGFYFAYSEGFRAPAFLELTCADSESPCVGIQAGVAPDTGFFKLRPVKVRNYEVGARTRPLPWLEGSVALYRTDVRDDIFSVSPAGTITLFFQNVGNTRREGVEFGLRGIYNGWLEGFVNYAFTHATFRDDITLASPRTPGVSQQVRKGDRLPLIPEQRINAGVRYHLYKWLTLSLNLTYTGDQFFRGDEANTQPKLDDYLILNAGLDLHWKRLSGFVKINNLTNNRYNTFGTFAPNAKLPGAPVERFMTPAPPINVLVGASYRF